MVPTRIPAHTPKLLHLPVFTIPQLAGLPFVLQFVLGLNTHVRFSTPPPVHETHGLFVPLFVQPAIVSVHIPLDTATQSNPYKMGSVVVGPPEFE